jgi:release factor glutamine methyltransferase
MQPTIQYIRKELQETYSENEIKELIKLIFREIRGYSFTDIYLKQEEQLTAKEREKVNTIVSRLKNSEPVQYILGRMEFYGLILHVNADVLIPRPETEEMAQWIISEQRTPPGVIMDIGTGSGCIALALKKAFLSSSVLGCDISEKAIKVARENSIMNDLDVQFFASDILNWRESGNWIKTDIIVSNPPYVTEVEKIHLRKNVLDFEPYLALFVPDIDPLLYYRHIAELCGVWLNKGGQLYFEINELYGVDVVKMLEFMKFSRIEIRKDFRGKDRVVRAFHE